MATDPTAQQWRSAANVLRSHADRLDHLALEAEQAGNVTAPELVTLLHHIDGQLGLAIHRGEGDQAEWKREASALVTRIRSMIRTLGGP